VRLGAKRAWRLRDNFFLNTLFFIAFAISTFSGVMTSFIALPALGIPLGNDGDWLLVHNRWTVYLLVLAGLHIAMNAGSSDAEVTLCGACASFAAQAARI
jgi:hypothetical protein